MAKGKTSSAKSDSSKVLYRKYRPTSLDDVIGEEQITTVLKNAITTKKIGHAYLFIGPRGTGKTSVARIFAHAVNDFSYTLEDDYLDIIEIDAASNTGVDNIRELREKAIIAPTSGKYKVYIIDEVHMLSKSAANALLKTLEEPPEHVIFIMATTEANKVPITISSRTQVFTFRLADPDTMFTHLQKVANAEKISIDDDALRLLVSRGDGSFRDSLSLLGQVATLSDQKLTKSLLEKSLGLPSDTLIKNLLSAYQAGDLATLESTLKDLLNTGFTPENIASELVREILAHPQPALFPLLEQLPNVTPPFPEAKLLLALCANIKPRPKPVAPVEPLKPAAAKPAAPVTETTPETSEPTPSVSQDTNFSWEVFLDTIHTNHSALFLQLQKCAHELIDNVLHLYPGQKFTLKILQKPENSQILTDNLHGCELIIHETGRPASIKDAKLSEISAIMGDVQEINEEMPF